MGMPIVVDVRDDDVGEPRSTSVFDWLRHVDATFSTYKADSEISRLNRGELELHEPTRTSARCSSAASELRDETSGYFDVRAASRARSTRRAS